MIKLNDFAHFMFRALENGIVFMASQSGVPEHYNLYFSKVVNGEMVSINLNYHEKERRVYRYASLENPKIEFNTPAELIDYIFEKFSVTREDQP